MALLDLLACLWSVNSSPSTTGSYDYDVALSFAGEDKSYVEEFAKMLKEQGVRVFYYEDALAESWGENLVDFLHGIYSRRARFALIFVSRKYVEKKWTDHERQSAQQRALEQAFPYILPIRLDDSELPGLHATLGYLDARRLGIERLASLTLEKIATGDSSGRRTADTSPRTWRTPRTATEISELLSERPTGWEYLLFAALVRDGVQKLDFRYRDHLVGYSKVSDRSIDDNNIPNELGRRLDHLTRITEFFGRLLDRGVQETAFGRPGESGDPDRITHLATRLCTVEEELVDWAAVLRSLTTSSDYSRRLLDALAHYADQPIEAIRTFESELVEQADTWNARLLTGETVRYDMTIKFDILPEVSNVFNSALRDFKHHVGEP
jgi:hypothetical protein